MSLSFTKEHVVGVQPTASLLSSTLVRSSSSGGGLSRSSSTGAVGASAPTAAAAAAAAPPVPTGGIAANPRMPLFTVSQVIAGIMSDASSGLGSDASKYELRIADDDGEVDNDFPSVDATVPITSVGVDTFVLVEAATEKPLLRVVIPLNTVPIRAVDASGDDLQITCYPLVAATGTRAIGFQGAYTGGGGRRPPTAADATSSGSLLDAATSAALAASTVGGSASSAGSSVDALASSLAGTRIGAAPAASSPATATGGISTTPSGAVLGGREGRLSLPGPRPGGLTAALAVGASTSSSAAAAAAGTAPAASTAAPATAAAGTDAAATSVSQSPSPSSPPGRKFTVTLTQRGPAA